MSRKLGQEEHFNKELAVLNNKLQNNVSHVKGSTKEVRETREYSTKVNHHFYPKSEYEEESENDEILERKKAWAQLEREQAEVKRNIKSLMKMAPESRIMDEPMLADRVRNVRYEPAQYNYEEEEQVEKKATKTTKQKEEKKPSAPSKT